MVVLVAILRYQTDQIYFKTAAEMCALFRHHPQAIASTLEVAEKIEKFDIKPGQSYMPDFPIPRGVASLEEYLSRLANDGVQKRYPVVTPAIQERLQHELAVINRMGYAGYFLITQDFINAARMRGIMVG